MFLPKFVQLKFLELFFTYPKIDLVSTLVDDCISRIGTKDRNNTWKTRRDALENLESTVIHSNRLVFTTPVCCKRIIELAKTLKEHLTDSQINLKPFASTIISCLLISQVLFRLSLVKFCVHP